MEYNVYHIPSNYTDAGRLFGAFEMRNAVETVLLTVPALFFCLYFLPLSLTPKIIATLTIIVPLGGFGLMGIRDDSLGRWLMGWWHFRKKRRRIAYRGEVNV